jgi:hypothetical protein
MRHIVFSVLLAAVMAACGDSGVLAPPAAPDRVYVFPRFVEAINEDLGVAQIGENGGSANDWELDGTTSDRNGLWAAIGSTVVLRVHSPLYQSLELSFIVPDTVTRNEYSRRVYYPIARLSRLVPAVLRAQWAADFTGPTVQVEIYAPHGLGGVRLTSVSVYWQACACNEITCYSCITGSADRPPWRPDSSATGLQAWAQLSDGWAHLGGRWSGWPSALPPPGYDPGWAASLRFTIEDDQGHSGHGSCSYGSIPSSERELACDVLFYR